MSRLSPNVFRWTLFSIICVLMTSYPVSVEAETKRYVASVRVYLDKKGHDLWKKQSGMTSKDQLRKELKSYFVDITDMYESLIDDVNIRMQFEVESITLLDQDILTPKDLKGDKVIWFMNKWHQPEYLRKKVDITVLFTGFNIVNAKGYGLIGQVCTNNSVAVVEYRAHPTDIQILAHEIAHVLGAKHDSSTDPRDPCYKKSLGIMNPIHKGSVSLNNYKFSPCVAAYVRDNIAKLDRKGQNCLTDGTNPVSGPRFGEVVTMDNVCRRKWGEGKFALTSYYLKHPRSEDLCLKLRCSGRHWKVDQNKYMRFPQGGKCGKNKICLKGRCVASPLGSSMVSDSCMFGDQMLTEYLNHYNRECNALPRKECGENKHKLSCCYSCNKNNPYIGKSADDVCAELFGDGWVLDRFAYSPKQYADKMCTELKCLKNIPGKGLVRKTSTSVPDGLACKPSWGRCYKGKCVNSNYRMPYTPLTSRRECPFGDQDLKALGFPQSCQELRNSCPASKKLACCMTCRR